MSRPKVGPGLWDRVGFCAALRNSEKHNPGRQSRNWCKGDGVHVADPQMGKPLSLAVGLDTESQGKWKGQGDVSS